MDREECKGDGGQEEKDMIAKDYEQCDDKTRADSQTSAKQRRADAHRLSERPVHHSFVLWFAMVTDRRPSLALRS